MTKQEEIREGMIDIIKGSVPAIVYHCLNVPTRWLVNKLLKYLHSQGVVIKVSRLLPFVSSNYKLSRHGVYASVSNEALNEQGYVAVEPLV